MRELLIAYTIKSRKKSVNKERYHTIFASAIYVFIHDLNNDEEKKRCVIYTHIYMYIILMRTFILLIGSTLCDSCDT